MKNIEMKKIELENVPLSESIYYIATEIAGAAEELLVCNKREQQVLSEDAKQLLEISKMLKEKGL